MVQWVTGTDPLTHSPRDLSRFVDPSDRWPVWPAVSSVSESLLQIKFSI